VRFPEARVLGFRESLSGGGVSFKKFLKWRRSMRSSRVEVRGSTIGIIVHAEGMIEVVSEAVLSHKIRTGLFWRWRLGSVMKKMGVSDSAIRSEVISEVSELIK
jgi:hypothetical protein